MKRRDVLRLLGGAAVSWPLVARAQQGERVRHVGVLMNLSENDLEARRLVTAFQERLAQLGWAEGRNLLTRLTCSGELRAMSIVYLEVHKQVTCRFSSRLRFSW